MMLAMDTLTDRFVDSRDFARIARAIRFIDHKYREQPRLAEIASHAGLSEFHFNRLFTRAFGETPHEFVTRRRIEEAKKMLLAENHSVTDICFDLGYDFGQFAFIPCGQRYGCAGARQLQRARAANSLGRSSYQGNPSF